MKKINVLNLKNLAYLFFISLLMVGCQDEPLFQEDTQEDIHEHVLGHRNCGKDHHMESLLADPDYARAYEKRMEKFRAYSIANVDTRALCSNPVVIPVAVHYQGVSSPNRSCLVALAQSQIQVLNKDFQGLNNDISKWNQDKTHFPGIANGETCIEFILANKNHPSGFGINDGDVAVTINKTNGDFSGQWSGYLNFFIQPNTGVLGYSPLGGAGNGDGVVIDANAFGTGNGCSGVNPQAPYNLGRTLTHELGHYLNLDHIWGNGCNVDDDVNDTPDQRAEHYDCPNVPVNSCGSNDLSMNYMDYVNDACMYMFSNGQSTRMENYVASALGGLVNNASSVIGSGSTGGDDGGNSGSNCGKPSNSQSVAVSTSTATLSWTNMPEAIKYRIKYKRVGTSGYSYKTVSSNSATLTGLQSGKEYQYNIRTQCPSGWTSYTSEFYFTTESSGSDGGGTSGCSNMKVSIKLDDFPEETSWEIVDDLTGSTVASGGPYGVNQAGKIKNKTVCLDDGLYSFYIDDEYGDGICCDYGFGYVKLRDSNNQVFASLDGYFGYYDVIYFEVSNGQFDFTSEDKDAKQVTVPKVARNISVNLD